ncbi:hypothetical protein C3942_13875 [Solimonas fluminis]|uniref:Pappalysin-1 SD scarf domain-containing protein n=1 Tax=Solimonas fluminis TaxID=2086571 RepID=A0A2S5TED4_9GAMM|nr:hypothetical protein [Solimonas fluminis]PPE73354.1 hypothetical protein C3942_13875 [Solimonas fluminis]
MKLRTAALPCLLLGLATVAACGKKQEAGTSAAAPAAEAPAAAAPAASDPAQEEAARQAADKKAAIERALQEQSIVEDAKGQWAVSATASSTYSYEKAPDATLEYTAMKATGKPDVESYGDSGSAWTSEKADAGIEWLELGFATPVNATGLRIRQSYYPGAIIKIELIDEAGSKHAVWEGSDDTAYPPSTTSWFVRSFEKTDYKAKGARITLATNAVPGWNEIDAVQLVGE